MEYEDKRQQIKGGATQKKAGKKSKKSGGDGSEEKTDDGDYESEDEDGILIPSRRFLKMSSLRQYAEVSRKKEMEEKAKAAAEKGISDAEASLRQLQQEQK